MPSRLSSPIITVDMGRVACIDPSNVDNLFSMWTIFSKCAESLENGRRLENLSWRLWNRETFCCDDGIPAPPTPSSSALPIRKTKRAELDTYSDMPELSASVESAPSDDDLPKERTETLGGARPCLMRSDSSLYRGKEKHMTPVNLARIMEDIELNKSSAEEWKVQRQRMQRKVSSMPTERVPAAIAALSKSVEDGSEARSARSTYSVVRGFSPSQISSSYRSSTNVAAPQIRTSPVKATAPTPAPATQKKSKQPVFYIGSSSSDDEDSFHSFSKHPKTKKTSFADTYDDDSDDDAVSESAIEDDDDVEWESSSESAVSSYNEGALFQRVESRPQMLTSRRSLLSTMLHEPQRAAQLASAASKSTPALRRCNPPREPFGRDEPEFPGSKPIRRVDSSHPLALSPRTTRRNMLATELTESLRKHLLWERQQRNTTASAHLKRRHTAADVTKLVEYPLPQCRTKGHASKTSSLNDNNPFEEAEHEYHAAGW